ncbi:MAG: site-2 protease family protein [Candidatus Thorarchaeota archaeon]
MSMKITKIKGIEIRLHLSTLLIVALVGFYAISFYTSIVSRASIIELLLVGLINGIILLISILMHELSHSIVAQKYGMNVSEIELYLFGGVSKIEEEPKTPKSELLIAAVGPLSSLFLGSIFLILFSLPISFPSIILVTLFYSGISNIGLGIFNLVPAFPIDGGRVLRAILWKRRNNIISATKSASKIGVGFAYGLMIYGFFQLLYFGFFNGFWLIIMGLFLRSNAKQAYIQTLNEFTLSNTSIREMLYIPKKNLGIPFGLTVSDAVRDYFIPYKKSYFPVFQGDEIVGVVHIADIRQVPIYQRSNYIIGYIMRKISEFPYIDEDLTGKEAMKIMKQLVKQPHILIVRGKETKDMIGFVGEEELISSLKYWNLNYQNS